MIRDDNSGAIKIARDAMVDQKSKLIDLKYRFVQNCHLNKKVTLLKLLAGMQTVDAQIKAFQFLGSRTSACGSDLSNQTHRLTLEGKCLIRTCTAALTCFISTFDMLPDFRLL